MKDKRNKPLSQAEEFARQNEMKPPSLLSEYFYFLKTTKKWWLWFILIIILGLGAFVVLSGSPVMPFIYALF